MRRLVLALLASIAVVGTAAAADMPVKAPVYKAPVVAPPYNWTGFYVGLNAGGSWGSQENDLVTVPGGVTLLSNSDNLDGFIGGGQIGYNWQINQFVLGVEADFQGSGQKADGSFLIPFIPAIVAPAVPGLTANYTDKLEWFGTVRARAGYTWDRWLAYVTGGWAFGHGTLSGTGTTTPAGTVLAFSTSQDYSGWTIGGGLEWAFADHWSAKAEYLYIDFGNGPTVVVNTAGSLAIASGRMTDNIARLGVNYHF
ncbi:MAG TPA: outer membrane protein [Pseudolabrys sp.]|nr:outer membrane protein [Pseudolabrys sp.]